MSSVAQTEKQADPSDIEPPQHTQQESVTTTEAPGSDNANSAPSTVLEGWR
jgi:hypothetical protein